MGTTPYQLHTQGLMLLAFDISSRSFADRQRETSFKEEKHIDI
jgi:hypothetical protein